MRIVVHDYSGHPFQVHLSRQLAQRGHHVTHMYCADNPGPKGSFEIRHDDSQLLHFTGVTLGYKSHAAGTGALGPTRILREFTYGREAAAIIRRIQPDVVLCGNTPVDAQRAIIRMCKRNSIRFVYWMQDIYSVAVMTLLAKRFGVVGEMVGRYYRHLDRRQLQASDAVIAISEDFAPVISRLIADIPMTVVENWGAIADIPVSDKANPWSTAHGLNDGFAYLYCGTLGRKHNPHVLARLAAHCQNGDTVAVVAQGYGVPKLQALKQADNTDTLHALKLLPIQPAKDLAHVLASADVLLASIEPEAGAFAVPSKVLSYLCAGRPILLAATKHNLAARIIERVGAGFVVDPDDDAAFLRAADKLRSDPTLRQEMGASGRAYAERTFDLNAITNRFETVLRRTLATDTSHVDNSLMATAK